MSRLRHDVAFPAALLGVEYLPLAEEQRKAAFEKLYQIIVGALLAYDNEKDQERRRLHPGEK